MAPRRPGGRPGAIEPSRPDELVQFHVGHARQPRGRQVPRDGRGAMRLWNGRREFARGLACVRVGVTVRVIVKSPESPAIGRAPHTEETRRSRTGNRKTTPPLPRPGRGGDTALELPPRKTSHASEPKVLLSGARRAPG